MKVFVTFPCLHWVHKTISHTSNKLLMDNLGYSLHVDYPTYKPFENNLHHCVVQFLNSGADYWLSIDDDNPPNRNPLELVALDRDIIGLPTPVWNHKGNGDYPIYLNAYRYVKERDAYVAWPTQEGLQNVDAVGTGCILMARRVFENAQMRRAPFQRTYNADGTVDKGNDIAFCERARKNGFQVWAHFDYQCKHFCELELSEVADAFAKP